MSLKKELSDLFTDQDRSEDMMNGNCYYNPTYPVNRWNRETKKLEPTGETVLVDEGYAKDLMRLDIDFESVDSYGGKGQGDEFWYVWKFTRNGEEVLVKFEGWYASYEGADFTDWSFVQPKQVTVTRYV